MLRALLARLRMWLNLLIGIVGPRGEQTRASASSCQGPPHSTGWALHRGRPAFDEGLTIVVLHFRTAASSTVAGFRSTNASTR